MRLQVIAVDSDVQTLTLLDGLLAGEAGMDLTMATSVARAKEAVRDVVAERRALDILIVADVLWDGWGVAFVEWLRNLPDDHVSAGGVRCRHLPVVMLSAHSREQQRRWLHPFDDSLPIVMKPFTSRDLLRTVDAAISRFRHDVMIELDRAGLAVTYDEGQVSCL